MLRGGLVTVLAHATGSAGPELDLPDLEQGVFGLGRTVSAEDDAVPDEVAGKRMLVQPFMAAIAATGEYSVMLFDGVFSHAILKTPRQGDFRVQPHLGGTEKPCSAPVGAIDLAKAALAAAPADSVYARVDMVAADDGTLRIMELELIEPALWLQHAPDQGAAFASAVRRAIEQP